MDPLKAALSQVPFETVSMDFIFALPSQTFGDLKADVDAAFEAGDNHVALYPFIDFTFTDSVLPSMGKRKSGGFWTRSPGTAWRPAVPEAPSGPLPGRSMLPTPP